ncbi:MAG: hypothetical protein HYV63_16575 [Candidatus Schekmanbacteria bacterium]|nr:hypothetical protein [Candidatus Schekmanbacteria bacterium]
MNRSLTRASARNKSSRPPTPIRRPVVSCPEKDIGRHSPARVSAVADGALIKELLQLP